MTISYYCMVLEANTLYKLHGAVIGTGQEVVQHAPDKFLPWCRREVEDNLLCDELVIKMSL